MEELKAQRKSKLLVDMFADEGTVFKLLYIDAARSGNSCAPNHFRVADRWGR